MYHRLRDATVPHLLPRMGVSFRTEDGRKLTTPAIDGAKFRWLQCWKTRDVFGNVEQFGMARQSKEGFG